MRLRWSFASKSCFSTDETEQKMAREFVQLTIGAEKMEEAAKAKRVAKIFCLIWSLVLSISFGLNIIFSMCSPQTVHPKKRHLETIHQRVTSKEKDSIQ